MSGYIYYLYIWSIPTIPTIMIMVIIWYLRQREEWDDAQDECRYTHGGSRGAVRVLTRLANSDRGSTAIRL